jgi:hypothetical protein
VLQLLDEGLDIRGDCFFCRVWFRLLRLEVWLTGVTLGEVTMMALFTGVCSFAFAFHAMRGM